LAIALFTACGREENRKLKSDAIAAETISPAAPAQGQLDMAPSPSTQPANMSVVQTPPPAPQIATNTPPPLLATTDATPAAGSTKEYTVAKGDTLLKIARANGIRFTALSNANRNINLSKLSVGQKLRIPSSTAASTTGIGFREPGNGVESASGNIHVV